MPRLLTVGACALLALAGAGCGSESTTTVIERSPTETVERTTTVEAAASRPKQQRKPRRAATNTVGLPLDVAEELLEESGYRVAAKNTDTTFGIIDPSNYTICTQGNPRGTIVPVLAQKYGC